MSKNPEKNELRGRVLKGTSAEVKKGSLLSLLVLYLINAGLSRLYRSWRAISFCVRVLLG